MHLPLTARIAYRMYELLEGDFGWNLNDKPQLNAYLTVRYPAYLAWIEKHQ